MAKVFVALGSNLKDPVSQVNKAFKALDALPNTRCVQQSSLYQTAPIGYTNEARKQVPDFINAVAELDSDLNPMEMLEAILAIENEAGRLRPYHHAPRVLDCDLLMHGDTTIQTAQLTLPHPRMHLRGFVLLPLFEIAPQLLIPNHGKIATLITPALSADITKLTLNLRNTR